MREGEREGVAEAGKDRGSRSGKLGIQSIQPWQPLPSFPPSVPNASFPTPHPLPPLVYAAELPGQQSKGEAQGAVKAREPTAQLYRGPPAAAGGRQAREHCQVVLPLLTRPTLVKPKDLAIQPEPETLLVHEPYTT